MKKLLSLIIISLFVMGGLVFADSNYTYENVVILGPSMGGAGQTPVVEAIRVTVGSDDDSIAVGHVMAWGIEPQYTDSNALGLVVNKCRRSMSEDTVLNAEGKGPYAGVMITTALSSDSGLGGWLNATPTRPQESMGFMAIRGYCDAYIDVGRATQGFPLVIHGNPATAGGGVAGYFATADKIKESTASWDTGLSVDIGVLLEAVASSDGLHKVWLR